MAVSELMDASLRVAARRAYERGRLHGALLRGVAAALLAVPGFLVCNQGPWAAICVAGFALTVAAARVRGEGFEEGARAGALAGILPCLLPAVVRIFDADLCALVSGYGPWVCGLGGLAAGVILGLRSRTGRGLPFWGSALAALGFAGSLGCIPAGAIGFAGLALGVVGGGAPILALRKASI